MNDAAEQVLAVIKELDLLIAMFTTSKQQELRNEARGMRQDLYWLYAELTDATD